MRNANARTTTRARPIGVRRIMVATLIACAAWALAASCLNGGAL
jgi:hypothetical protein